MPMRNRPRHYPWRNLGAEGGEYTNRPRAGRPPTVRMRRDRRIGVIAWDGAVRCFPETDSFPRKWEVDGIRTPSDGHFDMIFVPLENREKCRNRPGISSSPERFG